MSFKDLKVERVEGELGAALSKLYPFHRRGFIKIGEKKWFLPYRYAEDGDKVYNFVARPDDTWIVTYPRTGTTVTQELIWLVANDMNFDEAHRRHLLERFPFIDVYFTWNLILLYAMKAQDAECTRYFIRSDSTLDLIRKCRIPKLSSSYVKIGAILDNHIVTKDISGRINTEKSSIEFVRNQPSPRFIKSHLPLELLPTVVNSNCKIIYVARNPRDVVVSWYNFQKNLIQFSYQGTFEQFCNNFMNDNMQWSPYWEHVKEAWAMRHHRANMLFLFYEDLVKDLPGNIKKVADFFGKTYSDEQIAKLTEHLKIENFRKNPMVNEPSPGPMIRPEVFIRQGTTGGWKEMFTSEIEERFSKWIADNLKDTDLTFPG